MEDDMDQAKFDAMMADWLSRRDAMSPSGWSEEARKWAEETGLIQGDGKGNMTYKSFCTREELAVMLYRLEHPED
ncbi:MAG: CHAP domain-containing protein, partial [Candidatus Enterenecus sp.]